MQKCSDGIYLIGRYGNPLCGTWLFENNGDCALVEMPPFLRREGRPIEPIKEFIKEQNLSVPKYIFCSHTHMDHTYSIFHYRKAFPEANLIAHQSFFEDYFIRCFIYMYWIKNKRIYGEDIANSINLFNIVFASDVYQVDLGGEPIYLIYAPKHSYEDLMIIFRGVMITGDWSIGAYPDCNNIVFPQDKVRSIDRLLRILKELNYNVHSLFGVHGDNLMYGVDFEGIMEETKDYCSKEVRLLDGCEISYINSV